MTVARPLSRREARPQEPEAIRARMLRHDAALPRYTSYPTADRFGEDFGPDDQRRALRRLDTGRTGEPLSLYVHVPFCPRMCTYCGCNVVVTRSEAKKQSYVDLLLRELDGVAETLGPRRRLIQLHLGGGSPNELELGDLVRLTGAIRERFELDPEAEVAIELDPRRTSPERLFALRELGVTRLSLGVQDLDPEVERAVDRLESDERTAAVLREAGRLDYDSVSIDLIYGLPAQTRERFARTLERVIELAPDRVSLYSFAYVPHAKPHQRRIDASRLPDATTKASLYTDARQRLLEAGWLPVGMDHFARPGDPLGRAARAGTVHRNFQGYTVLDPDTPVVGVGVSAISDLGEAYAQNAKQLASWRRAVEAGRPPTLRGCWLGEEDRWRRWVIRSIMCRFRLDRAELAARWNLDLDRDLPAERARLRELEAEGLVVVDEGGVRLPDDAQPAVRRVASVFDAYLHETPAEHLPYSRVV